MVPASVMFMPQFCVLLVSSVHPFSSCWQRRWLPITAQVHVSPFSWSRSWLRRDQCAHYRLSRCVAVACYWLCWQTLAYIVYERGGKQMRRLLGSRGFFFFSAVTQWIDEAAPAPLFFQRREFDVYCSWLLFKRTSHLSKMPQERWLQVGAGPGSLCFLFHTHTHTHISAFHIFFCSSRTDEVGPWLAGQWPRSVIKNSV